jgi:hypothetical protein
MMKSKKMIPAPKDQAIVNTSHPSRFSSSPSGEKRSEIALAEAELTGVRKAAIAAGHRM